MVQKARFFAFCIAQKSLFNPTHSPGFFALKIPRWSAEHFFF
jgi:hypothetical protein